MSDLRIEPCPRRIRLYLHGHCILDTKRARYVFEPNRPYPVYYVPLADAVEGVLRPSEEPLEREQGGLGTAHHYDAHAGGHIAEHCFWEYGKHPELAGWLRFHWGPLAVFEEDERVWFHARNPWHRVDVLDSSRHVQVYVDGVKVADSTRPRLLFETDLPTRYYLPRTDVRMDLLQGSHTVTGCPYKGMARHWSVTVNGQAHHDLAWSYEHPHAEALAVAGRVCFYDERVDVVVDGVPQERPGDR